MLSVKGVERGLNVYLETFGCQMNESDSMRMLGLLKGMNYRRTEDPGEATLIILNTCSIRDKAEHKVYSLLGRFKELKKANPGLVIAVAGCVAQQTGERLFKRAPFVDLVLGPHNVHKLKDLLSGVSQGGRRVAATSFSAGIADDEYAYSGADGARAFVSIMRGCDNFCSYCIVPYTRGREVSRDSADILAEVEKLSIAGVREITLVGQNVNSYGTKGGDTSFPDLIRMCAGIEGIERIRFMTSHPKDISDELIGLFAAETKLCKHIHLPVQSGSDSVLRAMKRNYTRAEYLLKVERLKAACPNIDIAITTDIIVGFPGETDADFEDTMLLIDGVGFDNIFSFMYSSRPGTEAAAIPGHINASVKSERLRLLQDRQRQITAEKNAALIGTKASVLVEGRSKTQKDELTGRTQCNRIVNFPRPAEIGDTVKEGTLAQILITDGLANSLRGRLINAEARVDAIGKGRVDGLVPAMRQIGLDKASKESADVY